MDTGWLNKEDLFQYAAAVSNPVIGASSAKRSPESAIPCPAAKRGKPVLEPWGLPSRREEFDELGAPQPRSECFGCRRMCESEAGAVGREDLQKLLDVIRKAQSKTAPVGLATYVARRYELIRDDTNSNLMPGEEPLPDWTEATVLDHLRNHTLDPEQQSLNRHFEMLELSQIALNATVVRNPETGELTIDEKQGKMYLEFVKQLESQGRADLSKKLFYSGGNHVDMAAASEGPIAYSGKKLVEYWGKKN